MSAPSVLADARAIVPPQMQLAQTDPRLEHPLQAIEAQAIERAIPKRRAEFSAGRAAARLALHQLGLPDCAIPMGPDRAPVWPDGVLGSITHCETICLAGVARRSDLRMVGFDIEQATPLPGDVLYHVCTPRERRWISGTNDPMMFAKRIFSAKEAVFKAQYPQSGQIFGFEMLTLDMLPDSGVFTATFNADIRGFPAGSALRGNQIMSHGMILTSVAVPA